MACWASFAGGGWRAMLGSYVPVVLAGAGHVPAAIGILVALADATGFVVSAGLVRFANPRVRTGLVGGVVMTGFGLAVLPLAPWFIPLVAVGLTASGAGAGLVTTLGPAFATEAVEPGDVGAAIALTGTFRALALLSVPAGVAATLAVVPLAIAMATAGIVLVLPALLVSRSRARVGGTPVRSGS
jgi:hypothetical protein